MNVAVPIFLVLLAAGFLENAVQGDLCTDGVVVDSTCYRLPYRTGPRITYQKATDLCHFHGGVLAEIPTEEVYLVVFRYVKRSWYYEASPNYVQFWMGAQYNRPDGAVYLVGGGRSYVEWFPGYPTSPPSNILMAFEVPINPAHPIRNNGMFNHNAGHVAIPLCQFRLD